jgi:hypothetical protein
LEAEEVRGNGPPRRHAAVHGGGEDGGEGGINEEGHRERLETMTSGRSMVSLSFLREEENSNPLTDLSVKKKPKAKGGSMKTRLSARTCMKSIFTILT